MSNAANRILITGANGQLGRHVIDALLESVAPNNVVAMIRNPNDADQFTQRGLSVAIADYAQPESLATAFVGVERLLLISSNALGQRVQQHRNVVEAAKAAAIQHIAYTSILNLETSKMKLAEEHRATEKLILESGINYTMLRNGWYTENYTGSLAGTLAHGVQAGSAGEGRISSASRADYAAAAAVVLAEALAKHAGKMYELAGDTGFTLTEYAAEISRQSGQRIAYQNMPEDAYKALLIKVGLPEALAETLADSEIQTSKGALFNDSHTLQQLIGRPTTPLAKSVEAALSALEVKR